MSRRSQLFRLQTRGLAAVAFCIALAVSFSPAVLADARGDYVLATVRGVKAILSGRHVDAPSEARLAGGALAGIRRAAPDLNLRGEDWRAVEGALGALGARSAQALGLAGEAAIRGMVEAVQDPYTALMDREEMAADREGREQGAFTGIGVELAWDAGLVVVACLEGSPAAAAGILPGDRLLAIDGHPLRGLSFYRAGDLLTGQEGSVARLQVVRRGRSLLIQVPRRRLTLPGVEVRMVRTGIGLVRIGYFGPQTAAQVRSALQTLRSRGARRLVLDLRMNPGGDYQQGLMVAGLFRGGDLVQVQTRGGLQTVAAPSPPSWRGATAVLVDGGTASSAEIVAQALQGTPGIRVFGQRTFGKAAIQTLVPLPGGYGVRLTTGRYRSRAGVSVDRTGLAPDQPVPGGSDSLGSALAWLAGRP